MEVTSKQSADHAKVAERLLSYAQTHAVDKPALVQLRNEWLEHLNDGGELRDLGSDGEAEGDK